MTETLQFRLPLIAAAQAQKHVTVNEALLRLDALSALRLVSIATATPPASAPDGSAYVVPAGATDAWSGHETEIAIRLNGGWSFAQPLRGWAGFDIETGRGVLFDGVEWIPEAVAASQGGAATLHGVLEYDHVIGAGPTSTLAAAIPAMSQVLGVTARITSAIAGTATAWSLGVTGSADRYGSGLGLGLNSYAQGLTGTPVSYYADTDLLLSADAGDFAAGAVRIAVHLLQLRPPRAV